MNLRVRALIGLLCVGLATAQLNYRPEFISAGQGFRVASAYQQSKSFSKRQAPQGGGDPSDVIPHDQKKQTTFWWVAPDAPFKATKIGGGVQDPPAAGGGDQAAGAAAAGGAAAGQTGAAGQVGAFGATRSSQSSFSTRTFGTTGAAGGQTNQFGSTATRTTATQTTGQGAGGVGAFAGRTTGGTTISRTSTVTSSSTGVQGTAGQFGTANTGTTGQTVTGQTVAGQTVAGATRTTTSTATGRTTTGIGQQGQPGITGGLTTTSQVTRTQQTQTTGVAPVPVPQTNTATTTNTNTQTTVARTNTVTTSQSQQPPPTGTVQTNTFGQTTNTATATGTRTGLPPPNASPNGPGSGTTVTNTQENTATGRHSTTITSGVRVQPFLKKTTKTTSGYDYPVPLQVPCYEPNKVCVPNDYCVNDFVDEAQAQQVASNDQSCNSQTETCCRIRPAPPPPQATQCPDESYVCVSPSLCNNGILNFDAQNAISSQQPSGQCFAPDVCCKTQSLDTSSTVLTNEGYVNESASPANDTPAVVIPPRPNTPPRPPTNNGPPAPPPLPPIGCSAAMNCTESQYCSSTGVISKTPVNLTPEQELFRVPVTECRSPDQGFTGVCCRDPDYVDPWPVGMLGLYNPELLPFDDGSYKPNGNNGVGNGNSVQRTNEAIQAAPSRVTTAQTFGPNQITAASQTQYTQTAKSQYDRGVTAAASTTSAVQQQQTTSGGNGGSKRFTAGGLQFVHSGNTKFKPFQKQSNGQCAPRNYNTQPRGAGQWDTGFGEFPWQAMVIYEPNKSLLCGGAIIKDNIVVTAAKCVSGLNSRDIMIKGGEWRLGVDAEPKTFQIVRVKDIIYHPAYEPQTLNYDVAMLVLEDHLRFDTHIGAICLDENDVVPSASYDNCVTTGWGREVLRIHIGNALMRQMPISLLSEAESQRQLQSNGFAPESHICGRPAADACDVDIGSALACADTSGTYYLKGVYSTDNGCGRPDQIVSFSNIDVQWIKQALKNPNAFITPVPNFQTAANSPVISTVQQPSTLGPNYGKAYLPPY